MYSTIPQSHMVRHRYTSEHTSKQQRGKLIQLCICLAIFLTIYIGKGIFPTQLNQKSQQLMDAMTANINLKAAFTQLGASLSQEDVPVLEQLGEFCVAVFGPTSTADTSSLDKMTQTEAQFLASNPALSVCAVHYLGIELPEQHVSSTFEQATDTQTSTSIIPNDTSVPAVGTKLGDGGYDGMELPNNYTMDYLSLGTLDTCTPVLGPLWSEYGYRDHPINGAYQFHGGVDIGAYTGDPIGAFAQGVVEYTGENDDYGLYLQLDHGNGIKSFYAHCSKICVQKGQTVEKGEKIAEVGSTGDSTGPHLHLELKLDGIHLNPAYYVIFKES